MCANTMVFAFKRFAILGKGTVKVNVSKCSNRTKKKDKSKGLKWRARDSKVDDKFKNR